jgi:outer membrane protein assembly factor BamB
MRVFNRSGQRAIGPALLLTLLAGEAAAADWPQWRGPTHDGHAAGEQLVDALPAAGPPILWIRELGQGYSGFAVVDGRAYTQTQSLYEQSVVCLDGETGKTIWTYSYGWPYDGGGLYPGPRSTPAVHEGNVYFAAPSGLVGCLTAADGSLVWSVNVTEKFHGRGTDFGYSASPLVIDGLIILPVGGPGASVVALSLKDGSTVWKSGSQPASYSTLLPIEWRDEPLVIALLQNSLACFHRRSGELWWELPMSQGYDEHAAAPIYREPLLFVAGPFKSGAQVFRLDSDARQGEAREGDAREGEAPAEPLARRCKPVPVWLCDQLSNDVASSVLEGDTIFGFDLKDMQSRLHRPSRGEFRAVDFLTGEVRWSSDEPGHAQIIAADGKLVLFNDRGEVILAQASPMAYKELGRVTLFPDEICWTAPALSDGRFYLRTQTRAACIYLGREQLVTTQPTVSAADLPARTRFDPGSLLGGEREYPATLPQLAEFALWYSWCLGILVALLAAAVVATRFAGREITNHDLASNDSIQWWIGLPMWIAVFVAGSVGSAVLHRVQSEYVFTWPLALWAAFQIFVNFSWSTRGSRLWSWSRARCYGVGIAFILLCGLYFHLCRWLGLAIEWSFLAGFVGALPVAVLAARIGQTQRGISFGHAATLAASFSAYYWTCVGFAFWRMDSGT